MECPGRSVKAGRRRAENLSWKRTVEEIGDLDGPWPVDVAANPPPAVGECVVLQASPGGRMAYGWIHAVENADVVIKHYPPAISAMKEAVYAQRS